LLDKLERARPATNTEALAPGARALSIFELNLDVIVIVIVSASVCEDSSAYLLEVTMPLADSLALPSALI